MARLAKIFISISEGIIKKIPWASDYESVDEKSLSILDYVWKNVKRKEFRQ